MRFYLVLTGVLAVVLTGCSPGTDNRAEVPEEHYAGDLALMQGRWENDSVAGLSNCHAVVNGYRVLLSYRHGDSEELVRNNCAFEKVDEARKCLVMHSNSGAWPYKIEKNAGEDLFTLEFFCGDCKSWHSVELHRQRDELVGVH